MIQRYLFVFIAISISSVVKSSGLVPEEYYSNRSTVYPEETDDTNNMKSNYTGEYSDRNENSCQSNLCIRKCCPIGTYLTATNACKDFNGTVDDFFSEVSLESKNISLVIGYPPRPDPKVVCIRHVEADFTVKENGHVFLHSRQIYMDTEYYCIDLTQSDSGEMRAVAGLCYEPLRPPQFHQMAIRLQTGGHLASCSFIFVLIMIHVFSPNLRSSLHGKCFFSMCVALLFGYGSLVVIITPVTGYFNYEACLTLGLIVQYFMLSFWFWLTTRCYETLRIVRGTVKAIPLHLLNSSQNRFVKYSLVSWGSPLLISAFTLLMQTLRGVPEKLRPGIADNTCWIREKLVPLTIYYYGYQVLLHLLNIVFMAWCVYLLWSTGEAFQWCTAKKEDRLVPHNKKSLRMFWQQFYIFMLYIVILSLDSLSLIESKMLYWKLVDILNSLQGVILFVIFTLSNRKKNIFTYVWNRTSDMAKTLSTKLTPMKSSTRSTDQPKENQNAEEPV